MKKFPKFLPHGKCHTFTCIKIYVFFTTYVQLCQVIAVACIGSSLAHRLLSLVKASRVYVCEDLSFLTGLSPHPLH